MIALTRRNEALANAGTEAHQSDCSYWVERGKRLDFVGSRAPRAAVDRAHRAGGNPATLGPTLPLRAALPTALPPLDAASDAGVAGGDGDAKAVAAPAAAAARGGAGGGRAGARKAGRPQRGRTVIASAASDDT